jgi:Tol biopolymer transport system component
MSKHLRLSILASSLFLIALLLLSKQVAALSFSRLFSALSSGATVRASDSSEGVEGNGWSEDPDISADGRYTVFQSEADNLVANDYNQEIDVFLYDKLLGTTEVIAMGDYSSSRPSISADGRFVAFASRSDTFVPNDLNDEIDVFVYDRWQGAMELVSVNSAEEQTDFYSDTPTVSADGRYVSFASIASNLVPDDTNNSFDVFVRDRQLGITERVSVSSTGQQAEKAIGSAYPSSLSADGRFVVFQSLAGNLVPGDTNDDFDIFVRDRSLGLTTLVSRNAEGQPGNNDSMSADISADGRYVVFESWADNLVPNDTNQAYDVFLYDQWTATLERISLTASAEESNGHAFNPSISADGRFIAFHSTASNLVPNDTNDNTDVFVLDRQTGLLERVSLSSTGEEGNSASAFPAIAVNGRYIAFQSGASNLVLPDTNKTYDIFVRDQPFATLDSNHPGGAPGSYFTLTGSHFPPTSTATITVNGLTLGDVPTDAAGHAIFLLHTTDATPGLYTVRLTVSPYSAETQLTLHPAGDIHPQEGSGPIFDLPAGLAHHLLYFPFLPINTP